MFKELGHWLDAGLHDHPGAGWPRSWRSFYRLCIPTPKDRRGCGAAHPIVDRNRGHLTADGALRDLELSSAGLVAPDSCAVYQLVLASITVLAALPVLLAAPIFVSLQLLLGIFTACLWLTWTCAQLNRPLLGISTYALVWYLESFSRPATRGSI